MMGTLQRSTATAAPQRSQARQFAHATMAESRAVAASMATKRPQTSIVERVRTFVDRTLDAAFGRFDH